MPGDKPTLQQEIKVTAQRKSCGSRGIKHHRLNSSIELYTVSTQSKPNVVLLNFENF